jgi:hypothetical protein
MEKVNLTPYLTQFGLLYLGLSIAAAAFFYLTNVEAPAAMGLIVTMGAAFGVGQKFAMTNDRAMASGEKASFATLGAIVVTVLGAAQILALALIDGVGFSPSAILAGLGMADAPGWAIPAILVASLILSWLVLYFGVNFTAKQVLKAKAKSKS